jgi:DNA-binding beta-propeller fold protein YncE
MRGLFLLLAVILAGCKPAQVTLALDPGFYPSAVAHDPVNDRFFVGSHATGAIAIVRRDGHVAATVRPEQASQPVVQLAYEPGARRLWALTPDAVEAIDVAALPVRRTVIAGAGPGGRFTDIVADGAGRAYVLDAAGGVIAAIDASRQASRVLARLPDGAGDGSLMLLPDGAALVVARGGDLWRVEARSGGVERVALAAPLTDVSQLVLVASDATAHHVAAFRGRANEIVTLHLSADARRAVADAGTRMRYDTPLRGAFDGREVVVLLGRLRHHPSFGGDGRPNLPPRLATYFAGGAGGPRLAEAPPAARPALVR